LRRDVTVTAEVRSSRGKNEARRTRKAGLIPAVVYGAYQDPISVSVSPREINKIVRSSTGLNTIFNLAIQGGEATPVMVVDHQLDPIKGFLLHADLKRIDLTKRIKVSVPVHTAGEPKGVKVQGGLLEIVTRSVEVECLPDEIPEAFTVDVIELMIGQSKRAADIALDGSVRLISPADQVIAHVVNMRGEEATTDAAATPEGAAATAEPEVIKKGKKEEEAAEEKGKKK
jgi:large subunit ribosomal protein L25